MKLLSSVAVLLFCNISRGVADLNKNDIVSSRPNVLIPDHLMPTDEIRQESLLTMIFADDIVICCKIRE